MLRGILDEEEADCWIHGQVGFQVGDDEGGEEVRVSEGIVLGLVGERLGGEYLHGAGNEVSVEYGG